MNEWLLALARFLAAQDWSISLHESIYMYGWIESVHVLTLTVFLGMLFLIDLRMLGWAMPSISAEALAARLDRPMLLGFLVMVVSGLLLYYAIPVRTTQSVWFRMKVVLMLAAGLNAWLFRRRMRASSHDWTGSSVAPVRFRVGAGLSLLLWSGVVFTGRAIAYDWFDCHKPLSTVMLWAAGCVDELATGG
ncbi:MAG: DUF6644 family protein [Pseudomonadales bacterium]